MLAMRSLKVMQIKERRICAHPTTSYVWHDTHHSALSNVDFGNDNNACSHSSKTMLGVTGIFSSAVKFFSEKSISQSVITFIKMRKSSKLET